MKHSISPGIARCATLAAATALVVVGASGCVIPVSYSEPASPAVVGQYTRSDGTPVSGARVVVTSDGDDATCSRPLGVGTTSSAGTFELPPTMMQRRGVWLVPAIEHFTNSYWVCASAGDTLLHIGYGGVTFLSGAPSMAPDSLTCLQWAWQDSIRVTCAGPNEKRAIQAGGRWTEGDATGFYRLIVIEQRWDAREPGVYLQWVERAARGSPEIVRKTIALPVAPKIFQLVEAELWPESGRLPTCVTVHTTGEAPGFWTWKTPRERATLALGAPGELRRVAHCADAARP